MRCIPMHIHWTFQKKPQKNTDFDSTITTFIEWEYRQQTYDSVVVWCEEIISVFVVGWLPKIRLRETTEEKGYKSNWKYDVSHRIENCIDRKLIRMEMKKKNCSTFFAICHKSDQVVCVHVAQVKLPLLPLLYMHWSFPLNFWMCHDTQIHTLL